MTQDTTNVMAKTTQVMANFEIIDYSEKSIAVVGDTREIKDALARLGGRFNARLKCGAGWIFPKSKREGVEAVLRGETPTPKPKAGQLPDYFLTDAERREFWESEGETNNGLKMLDYHIKRYPLAVRLTDGRVIFCERDHLKTSFCFGHGQNGVTTEEETRMAFRCEDYARTQEDYFISKNMERIRDYVADAKGTSEKGYSNNGCKYCYSYSVRPSEGRKEQQLLFSDYTKDELLGGCEYHFYLSNEQAESLTLIEGEDRQRVVALYEAEEANRLRRVQSYLKRYGLSKLKTWTYLVD